MPAPVFVVIFPSGEISRDNLTTSPLSCVRVTGKAYVRPRWNLCYFRNSAIYFPAYSHLRTDLFREGRDGKKLTFLCVFTELD